MIRLALLFGLALGAAEPATDVREWEVVAPPARGSGDWWVFAYRANRSPFGWHVWRDGTVVRAELDERSRHVGGLAPGRAPRAERPPFMPATETFGAWPRPDPVARVADGWLVGFNRGEWGGALYWFDTRGAAPYRIADDTVAAFVPTPGGVHALSTMPALLSIRAEAGRWRATTLATLPERAHAAVARRDGTILVPCDETLVAVRPDGTTTTLAEELGFTLFNIRSAALDADDAVLYVGMQQFVAEITLATRAVRWLSPGAGWRHVLSPDEEASIRRPFEPDRRGDGG